MPMGLMVGTSQINSNSLAVHFSSVYVLILVPSHWITESHIISREVFQVEMFRSRCDYVFGIFHSVTCKMFINPISELSIHFNNVLFTIFSTFNQVNYVRNFTGEQYEFR